MTVSDTLLQKAEQTMASYPKGNIFPGSNIASQSLSSALSMNLHPQTQRPVQSPKIKP